MWAVLGRQRGVALGQTCRPSGMALVAHVVEVAFVAIHTERGSCQEADGQEAGGSGVRSGSRPGARPSLCLCALEPIAAVLRPLRLVLAERSGLRAEGGA